MTSKSAENEPVVPYEFIECISKLSRDEIRVLHVIAERLLVGMKSYGKLNLCRDKRNWCKESLEEMLDGAVYFSCAMLKCKNNDLRDATREDDLRLQAKLEML